MPAVEREALGDVGRREDLLDRHVEAVVDQLHHQLIVGDPEVAEAPEARARIHQEAQQDPALGVEDVLLGELRGVGAIDRLHHLVADAREALGSAEVVVDDARGGRGVGDHHAVGGLLG